MSELMEIGKIVNTHGVKGAIKVMPSTDIPERFELLDTIIVKTKRGQRELTINRVQYQKSMLILTLDEIKDMTEAETLKTARIYIPRDQALPLDKDEYYISDLYGMEVVTDEGTSLGKIQDIIFTGANDVYQVKNASGEEVLIPAIKDCVQSVDVENNKMTVKLLKGLLD